MYLFAKSLLYPFISHLSSFIFGVDGHEILLHIPFSSKQRQFCRYMLMSWIFLILYSKVLYTITFLASLHTMVHCHLTFYKAFRYVLLAIILFRFFPYPFSLPPRREFVKVGCLDLSIILLISFFHKQMIGIIVSEVLTSLVFSQPYTTWLQLYGLN